MAKKEEEERLEAEALALALGQEGDHLAADALATRPEEEEVLAGPHRSGSTERGRGGPRS